MVLALLYSAGAHGIMTLNDFKAIEGDRKMGIASLPVQLGPTGAAWAACATMVLAQLAVIGCLLAWGQPVHAVAIAGCMAVQLLMMKRFVAKPVARAVWFSGLGVPLYVAGMMISAFALRGGVQ
jgi:chlorophyll synthase